MKKKRKPRDYDNIRKRNTLEKLRTGFKELKEANPQQPVTKYALSKNTGVARQTIAQYPEIVKLLEEENGPHFKAQTPDGIVIINTQEDIARLVAYYQESLKEKEEVNKKLVQLNSSLDLRIVQLSEENRRLNSKIERYERAMRNKNNED